MATKKSALSQYLSEIGRRGGEAKVKKGLAAMTKEQRDSIRAKGLLARKKAVKKKAVKGKKAETN